MINLRHHHQCCPQIKFMEMALEVRLNRLNFHRRSRTKTPIAPPPAIILNCKWVNFGIYSFLIGRHFHQRRIECSHLIKSDSFGRGWQLETCALCNEILNRLRFIQMGWMAADGRYVILFVARKRHCLRLSAIQIKFTLFKCCRSARRRTRDYAIKCRNVHLIS